jgi:hypothetical protein
MNSIGIMNTNFEGLSLVSRGKVRDITTSTPPADRRDRQDFRLRPHHAKPIPGKVRC